VHARNLTSVFTDLLKVPLNVGLRAKCSRLMGNQGPSIHFRWRICDRR